LITFQAQIILVMHLQNICVDKAHRLMLFFQDQAANNFQSNPEVMIKYQVAHF